MLQRGLVAIAVVQFIPWSILFTGPNQNEWVIQGAVDVDIGANPSAEGVDADNGVDDQTGGARSWHWSFHW